MPPMPITSLTRYPLSIVPSDKIIDPIAIAVRRRSPESPIPEHAKCYSPNLRSGEFLAFDQGPSFHPEPGRVEQAMTASERR